MDWPWPSKLENEAHYVLTLHENEQEKNSDIAAPEVEGFLYILNFREDLFKVGIETLAGKRVKLHSVGRTLIDEAKWVFKSDAEAKIAEAVVKEYLQKARIESNGTEWLNPSLVTWGRLWGFCHIVAEYHGGEATKNGVRQR
jgi:hypothetical protein